jgi:hypothetical protein
MAPSFNRFAALIIPSIAYQNSNMTTTPAFASHLTKNITPTSAGNPQWYIFDIIRKLKIKRKVRKNKLHLDCFGLRPRNDDMP